MTVAVSGERGVSWAILRTVPAPRQFPLGYDTLKARLKFVPEITCVKYKSDPWGAHIQLSTVFPELTCENAPA